MSRNDNVLTFEQELMNQNQSQPAIHVHFVLPRIGGASLWVRNINGDWEISAAGAHPITLCEQEMSRLVDALERLRAAQLISSLDPPPTPPV